MIKRTIEGRHACPECIDTSWAPDRRLKRIHPARKTWATESRSRLTGRTFPMSRPRAPHPAAWVHPGCLPIPGATRRRNAPHADAWAFLPLPTGPRSLGCLRVGRLPAWAHTQQEGAAMDAECTTAGCVAPVIARGLCRRCYMDARGRRLGPCTVHDCTRPQHAQGLCMTHYWPIWRRQRDNAPENATA
jgi:hypothetical protein